MLRPLSKIFLAWQIFLHSAQSFSCPPAASILPCKCDFYTGTQEGILICTGENVTQESINRVFDALRKVNELTPTSWLTFSYFRIEFTNMTSFDLTPLFYTRLATFTLFNNTELVTIGSSLKEVQATQGQGQGQYKGHPLIDVQDFVIGQSPLTDESFAGGWLHFFNPSSLKKFGWGNTQIKGRLDFFTENGQREFVPGLSSFPNLENLELSHSKTERIGGGQFKHLSQLDELYLAKNELVEIGENAIELNWSSNKTSTIKIWMGYNSNLKESSFHPNWAGLNNGVKQNRPIDLDLSWTNLTSIPEDKFKSFLDAHLKNEVNLFGAPLQCDQRVAWLKSLRADFEERVKVFATCEDGKTIFNSDLVKTS